MDTITQTVSNIKETITHFGATDEKSTDSESSSYVTEELTDNELESSNIDKEKENLVEASKEILAAPLQSAVDTYEKIVSTQEDFTPTDTTPTKSTTTTATTTSGYPWFTSQYKIADSEIERLSTPQESSFDKSDQTETSITEETKLEDQFEQKPSQQLQVINDDYPWYSSYYTIADADANMGELYERLSDTINQLDQRPSSTTVEFQPEPHETVSTPEYDHQALADTKDTREKVHELAQLSTVITTTKTETVPQVKEDEFQVVQPVPSSTTVTTKSPVSPDNDLTSVVLPEQSSISSIPSPIVSQTTATTTTSSKKKSKKHKKDKTEASLSDEPVPSITDINEPKVEDIQTKVVEEQRIETTEPELLTTSTTDDSGQIDQTSEEIKNEFEQLIQNIDEVQQKLSDTKDEEQYNEPLSSSIISDIEVKQVDDEKNDSTSSDASQWLSSSYTTFPEDNKVDTGTTQQAVVTETTTTISSSGQEPVQSEILPISTPTKKKKPKQKPTDQESRRPPEVPSSTITVEEPKVQSKPIPPTPLKTTSGTIRPKIVISPQDEEVEDDEGFQVVTYRKRVPSFTAPENISSPLRASTPKQKRGPDFDSKAAAKQERPRSATSTVSQTTTTQKKPKKDKSDSVFVDAPLSSASTDTDLISSSSIDTSGANQIERQATDQPKKGTDTTESKASFASVSATSPVASPTTKEKPKQRPKDQETILQSQALSSSLPSVTDTNVKSKSALAPVTLRAKASTSPDEVEDDDEGFQVVRYRKRISSAPRSEKALPPTPPKTSYKQNLGRNLNVKPGVIHGRHGSETRSMPRTTSTGQSFPNKRQQIRPKQDRPPFSGPRSPAPQETQIISSLGSENQTIEQTKQPAGDKPQRMSDIILQSLPPSSIDQTPKPIQQQKSIEKERQPILPSVQSKPSDQKQQQKITETKTEQSSTNVLSPVDKPIQSIVQEYDVPTTDEIKAVVQQASCKETIPSIVTATTTTTVTRKSTLSDDEDEDGFRVVRYRKNTPVSTPTAEPQKQQSFGFDSDKKKPSNIPRKKPSTSSSSITTPPPPTVSQTTTPKKKPIKPKKSQEEIAVSQVIPSTDILSSSITDSDLASSSIEDFSKQTTSEYIEQVLESQPIMEDIPSPRSDNEVTATTTYGTITTETNEPVQSIEELTQIVEKPLSDVQNEVQSTTSPAVTSADTSEESSKKLKKKHKRQKREPDESELSTPSDEASGTIETHSSSKTIPISSSTQAPSTDIPLTSSPIDKVSEKITTSEETIPSLLVESTTNIEDEQVTTTTTTSSKKTTKRRKKKPHTTENKSEEDVLRSSSSTTTTTDKDSSGSAAATLPVKQASLESGSKNRSISDDDKQESEWITAQGRKKKSKGTEPTVSSQSTEQKVSSYTQSRSQPITPKIVPEKVTDVQFKFKKGGELTMTSQSSIESSPTEWGTVKFLPEEQNLSQPIQLDSSTEQITSQQPIIEQESVTEQITVLTPKIDTEIKTETSSKSMESSETGGEADLDAYRDQTGRLRRKKPRKNTGSLIKSEDTSSTLEQQISEENTVDRRSISEHWADVLATPISNLDDEEEEPQAKFIQEEQSFEDEDTNETSSKLDSFLPDYIRQQIKTSSIPRSSSLNNDRSKSSSTDLSTSITQSHLTRALPPSSSNRSTSTDTSENESRKQLEESFDRDNYSTTSSNLPSTLNFTQGDSMFTSSPVASSSTTRKKKQRPKMLKKDHEAKTLLTHEFDDTPLTITEVQQTSPVTQMVEDDELYRSSIRQQFASATSTITDAYVSAVASSNQTTTDEQSNLQSDEPIPSIEDSSIVSSSTPSESTSVTAKKSSARSPRKRSKRDSGPDYENVVLQTSGDIDQSFTDKKVTTTVPTSTDTNQSDSTKTETHKQQLRQRTSSGRQIQNSEEENEQQAMLADDEEDGDVTSKSSGVSHGTSTSTKIQPSSELSIEKQDSSSTATSRQKQTKKESGTEDIESVAQVSDEVKTDTEDTTSDQQTSINEPLRSVQGFHTFTPNKYQYNQYEEVPTIPPEPLKSNQTETRTETESADKILSRGLNLWLQENKEDESTSSPSSSSKKEEQQPAVVSGLTRAMQSLIIQPVESENEDEDEEEDSWNGPRAKKPTYTTGIRIDKRIHATSGYNINHPRSTATAPSWLISPSDDNTFQDDPSKFDPDNEEEGDSIDDTSDKQLLSPTIDTQFSTTEERQAHLNNLADLTFPPTISNLSSSSSSSLSSAVKWNETSIRSSDENTPQQTSFTEDDVQRCLGEDFYRESLAPDTPPTEQRTITRLEDLVLKPSQSSEDNDDDDDDEDDNQTNRNNNNNNSKYSINFDEWAHFLEHKNNQQMFSTSLPTSSTIEQDLSTTHECSYARVLDDDTLVSDADHTNIKDYTQHLCENEPQRYGDFSSLNDDSIVPQSPINSPLISPNPEQQVQQRDKPSERFRRWHNQSNRDREESRTSFSNQISTENQNDDEVIISHSEGGLSRRVRPSS